MQEAQDRISTSRQQRRHRPQFVRGVAVPFEESLTCELKEVRGSPIQAVGSTVDEYVVAFLNAAGGSVFWGVEDQSRVVTGFEADSRVRDQLRQVIGQKIANIAPPIATDVLDTQFYPVHDADGHRIPEMAVLEVGVERTQEATLYLTGSGAAYRRTVGGNQKLNGLQLITELAGQLSKKREAEGESLLAELPAVYRRAQLVASAIRGRRVLVVDDNPLNNVYERALMSELGLTVDVATSTDDALAFAAYRRPDIVVSDMARGDDPTAGLTLMKALRATMAAVPVVFYVAALDRSRGVPPYAFGITNKPDELIHLVLDAAERSA